MSSTDHNTAQSKSSSSYKGGTRSGALVKQPDEILKSDRARRDIDYILKNKEAFFPQKRKDSKT